MTTEVINIQIREDGSRVVSRNIDEIGKSSDKAANSVDILKGVLGGLVAAFSFSKFAEFTGVWTDLNARVARFAGTAENTTAIMDRLMSVAQRTYAPLESTSEIFLQNAFSLQELGKSTEEALDYTEAMTNALVVSGTKGQRAESVINALSKSMLEGKLRGDNWNTVLQQGGRIVEALTQETGKSLVELREMAKAGKLDSNTVFNALVNQLDTLRQEADDMPATIGDAFIRMRNRVIQELGKLDEQLGLSQAFVKFIDFINENLDKIIPIVAGIGAAIAVAFAPGVIIKFAAQIKSLFVLMAAHPLVAIAAAVTGVVTALYLMRDEIKLGIDDTTTLGDLMTAVWEQILPLIQTVAEAVGDFFGWLTQTSDDTFDGMLDNLSAYERTNESTWLKILRAVAYTIDAILGLLLGLFNAGQRIFTALADLVVTSFGNAIAQVRAVFSGDFSKAIEVGQSHLDNLKNTGSKIGNAFGEGLDTGFGAIMEGGLEARLNTAIDRAQELSRERGAGAAADLSGRTGGGGGAVVDPNAAKKAARELEKLKNALARVLDQADPLAAAHRQLAEAQDILNRAVAKGLISQEEAATVYEKLKFQMQDMLDPLGAVNREIDQSIELLKLSNEQREIEAQMLGLTESLRKSGVDLTKEEIDALRAKLIVEQELAKFARARDNASANSFSSMLEEFQTEAMAIKSLLDDASSGYTSGDVAIMITQTLGQITDGTQLAAEAAVASWQFMYDQIQVLRDEDLINEQQASELRRAIRKQELDLYLQRTSDALGAASGLMKANSKEAFKIGQAAAIAQAIVNTYTAATAAYQSAAAIPFVGWVLGPIAAAGAIAAGMAQVSAIRSQTMPAYRTGGSYTIGGSGGVDSQVVAFRGTPGEQISINTPSQANAMQNIESLLREDRQGRRGNFYSSLTIVQQGRPDNKTTEQQAKKVRKVQQREFEENM